MSRKSKPSNDELERMTTHVMFEVDMFRQSFARWRVLKVDSPQWNPTLESSLLHFRILRVFFLCTARKYGDDVLAADYVTHTQWNPSLQPVLLETKDDVDKRLAHLTTRRLEPKPIWKRGQMEVAIEELIATLKNSLRAPKSGWFSSLETRTLGASLADDTSVGTQTEIKYHLL